MLEFSPGLAQLVARANYEVADAVDDLWRAVEDPNTTSNDISVLAARASRIIADFNEKVYDEWSEGALQELFEAAASRLDN